MARTAALNITYKGKDISKDISASLINFTYTDNEQGSADEIELLLEKFGRDAVMVGDRDNDVQAASRCGIPCIGVAWGYAEPGELEREGAIAVAHDTEELNNLLVR